jgi:serine O-acetyltransferase
VNSLRLSLPAEALTDYVQAQVRNFFPDGHGVSVIAGYVPAALERLRHAIDCVRARYFRDNGVSTFSHLNNDQYAMFLYLLAHEIARHEGGGGVCDKLFGLNKALHGLDCYYGIDLPEVFLFCHPVGTVLGRAKYSDFFLVYQNCTVGSNHDTDHPVIGRCVALYKGSSVLGASRIGNNCKIAADATVMDQDVPDGSIYFGRMGSSQIKPCRRPDNAWDPDRL